jgi:hypothetical protein
MHIGLRIVALLVTSAAVPSVAATMYGGVGRGSSVNPGSLIAINDTNADATLIGHPAGVPGLNGLAFNSAGALFGTTISSPRFEEPVPFSTLVRMNPATGELLHETDITFDGSPLPVSDLAIQPGTSVLFITALVLGPSVTNAIYTLDPNTGIASFIGETGVIGASLAFGPDGTLYMSSAEFDVPGVFSRGFLNTIDPTDAHVITTSGPFTLAHVGGLAVRPTDGTVFASGNMGGGVYTIALDGTMTQVGSSDAGAPGDLAFAPVPEGNSGALVLLGAAVIAAGRSRRNAQGKAIT